MLISYGWLAGVCMYNSR